MKVLTDLVPGTLVLRHVPPHYGAVSVARQDPSPGRVDHDGADEAVGAVESLGLVSPAVGDSHLPVSAAQHEAAL